MFAFNFFSTIESQGYKKLETLGGVTTPILFVQLAFLHGREFIVATDKTGKHHKFDLTNLGWFADDGVALMLESQPFYVNGQARCDRWRLTR